jgi:hypothetical protein
MCTPALASFVALTTHANAMQAAIIIDMMRAIDSSLFAYDSAPNSTHNTRSDSLTTAAFLPSGKHA